MRPAIEALRREVEDLLGDRPADRRT